MNLDIYHKTAKLSLSWLDLLTLYYTVRLVCDVVVSDASQFAIYSKVIELFEKQIGRESDTKAAGDVGALFRVMQRNLFSPYEKQLWGIVVGDCDQQQVEQFQVTVEQLLFDMLAKVQMYPQHKALTAYVDSLRIQQKQLSI